MSGRSEAQWDWVGGGGNDGESLDTQSKYSSVWPESIVGLTRNLGRSKRHWSWPESQCCQWGIIVVEVRGGLGALGKLLGGCRLEDKSLLDGWRWHM
jgi:hypothetical protein